MFGRIGIAIGRFFTSFVFSPFVWAGFALLGGAVALEFAARAMRARGMGDAPARRRRVAKPVGGSPAQVERSRSAPTAEPRRRPTTTWPTSRSCSAAAASPEPLAVAETRCRIRRAVAG